MPATSKAQQRLMGAAEHGATFPMARKLRASMTHEQLHDFAAGSEAGKPEHVAKPKKPRKGAPKRDSGDSYSEANAYDFRTGGKSKITAPKRATPKPGAAY